MNGYYIKWEADGREETSFVEANNESDARRQIKSFLRGYDYKIISVTRA